MNPKLMFWMFALLGVGFEIVGDVFFKKWSLEHRSWMIAAGLIIYTIGTACWAYTLKYEMLSKAISVFTILNLVAVVLVGVIYFKEDLSLTAKIGMILGIISIALIEQS